MIAGDVVSAGLARAGLVSNGVMKPAIIARRMSNLQTTRLAWQSIFRKICGQVFFRTEFFISSWIYCALRAETKERLSKINEIDHYNLARLL